MAFAPAAANCDDRGVRAFAFLSVLACCFGCNGDSPSEDAAVDRADLMPRLEIGLGTTEFNEIGVGTAPTEAELVNGPQGGWHIDVAFRLYGVEPGDITLRIWGYDVATEEERTIRIQRFLTPRRVTPRGDHLLRLGDQMIFMVEDGSEAVGLDLRIEAEIEPEGGPIAMAQETVRIVDNEM